MESTSINNNNDYEHFIILDLEWNSVYVRKIQGYLNEIIEIGAVKLDKSLNIVDEFSIKIRPVFSRKLTKIVKNLTGLVEEDLEDGVPYSKSMSEFRKWIGNETAVIMTWSNTDLLVLLENYKYFYNCDFIPFLQCYSDLQKYCQFMLETGNREQLGLSAAAEKLGIDITKMEVHRALDDSVIAAKIFKKINNFKLFENFIKKADKPFYDRLTFKPSFISSINDPQFNKKDLSFRCDKCGEKLSQKTKWFYRNHSFHAFLECNKCALIYNARVQTKITYDEAKTKRRLILHEPNKTEDDSTENS